MHGRESLRCSRGGQVLNGLIAESHSADTNLACLLSEVSVTYWGMVNMTRIIEVGGKTFQSGRFQVNIDAGCRWDAPGASRDEVTLVEMCLQEEVVSGRVTKRNYVGWVVEGNNVFPVRGSFKDPYSKVTVEYLDGGIGLLAEILKALRHQRGVELF